MTLLERHLSRILVFAVLRIAAERDALAARVEAGQDGPRDADEHDTLAEYDAAVARWMQILSGAPAPEWQAAHRVLTKRLSAPRKARQGTVSSHPARARCAGGGVTTRRA